MHAFTRAKWIEIADGACAIEILENSSDHSKFVLHHRFIKGTGEHCWATVHTSGLYADIASAEADGLRQWRELRKAWFGGMTTNERLVLGGLIAAWDDAVRKGDRRRLTAILSAVELESQADQIIDSALRRASG
jgi:hypothetical protein